LALCIGTQLQRGYRNPADRKCPRTTRARRAPTLPLDAAANAGARTSSAIMRRFYPTMRLPSRAVFSERTGQSTRKSGWLASTR
jgi:hypothetical protein